MLPDIKTNPKKIDFFGRKLNFLTLFREIENFD